MNDWRACQLSACHTMNSSSVMINPKRCSISIRLIGVVRTSMARVFSREDFTALSKLLKAIKGYFIMSINDVVEFRELFAWAEIKALIRTFQSRERAALKLMSC